MPFRQFGNRVNGFFGYQLQLGQGNRVSFEREVVNFELNS